MKIIEKIHIDRFRGFENVDISFNRPINAIIGRNGTMKTTLLGILAQPFTLETGEMSKEEPLIGGKKFNSRMSEKFKFSDTFDKEGEHKWTLTITPDVYPKKEYTCLSERRTDNHQIRFWSTEGRKKGMNYIQCPVIYLSMKRLLPIGEEKKLKISETALTEKEKELYIEWHNRILICNEGITHVSNLVSSNKLTIGPTTNHSDAVTISAGQDNVGRIILAILSMKRLQEKYKEEYRGGIIFIDEVESTLYPAAQEKLIDFMHETAYKYRLQYFFTTHSVSTVRYLKTGNHNERNKIVYLRNINGKIKATEDPSLMDIENHLNVAAGRKKSRTNIKVYCEDEEGILFTKALLPPRIKSEIEFVTGINLSWTVFKTLYEKRVPEFQNNLLVLDGDVGNPDNWGEKCPRNVNIVLLPSKMAPERLIYETLYNLDQADPFWENESLSGYTKDVCFRDFPNHMEKIEDIKDWFKAQKDFAGRGYSKFINYWKKNNADLVEKFVNDFVGAYNYVAKRVGSPVVERK